MVQQYQNTPPILLKISSRILRSFSKPQNSIQIVRRFSIDTTNVQTVAYGICVDQKSISVPCKYFTILVGFGKYYRRINAQHFPYAHSTAPVIDVQRATAYRVCFGPGDGRH